MFYGIKCDMRLCFCVRFFCGKNVIYSIHELLIKLLFFEYMKLVMVFNVFIILYYVFALCEQNKTFKNKNTKTQKINVKRVL